MLEEVRNLPAVVKLAIEQDECFPVWLAGDNSTANAGDAKHFSQDGGGAFHMLQ